MMAVPWGMTNHCGEKLNSARAGGYAGGAGMISINMLIRHVEYAEVEEKRFDRLCSAKQKLAR